MIVWGICLRWTQVTGGENGMRGDVRPAFLVAHRAFYWAVLAAHGDRQLCDVAICPLAVRPDAARHPRQREPHAEPRLQRAAASVHRLYGVRLLRRHRRRALCDVQQFRQPFDGGAGAIGRGRADDDRRRRRHAVRRLRRGCCDPHAGERRQLLYRALADGARPDLHRDHDLRPGGHYRHAARHSAARWAGKGRYKDN